MDISCAPLPPGAPGECVVTQAPSGSTRKILIEAALLGPEGLIESGALLFDAASQNGRVLCVGCDCEQLVDADTTRVTCPDGVVTPGLINPHDHLSWALNPPALPRGQERFEHRHDWRKGKRGHQSISAGPSDNGREALLYGELRMLMGAATSIAGSNSTRDLLRNLDDSNANGGLGNFEADYRTFPLGDSDGTLVASGCDRYMIDAASRLNSRVYLPHVAEGIDPEARNEFACLSGEGGVDLIARNTSMIHGVGLSPADILSVAADGASLVWSPRSNVQLYGHTAPVVSYMYAGVNIALGTDWTPSGSMNMLRELRCADLLNRSYYGAFFSDRQVWQMATANAAKALGVGDQLGALRVGYVADVALLHRFDKAPYRAVLEATPEAVALVARGGKVLYGDAGLVEAVNTQGCDALSVCGAEKRVCLQSDAGLTLSALQSAVGGAYPLFFCEEPASEPTCVPYREGEFNGQSLPDDQDGDGVLDAQDSCPTVFNAPRPLEGDAQGDADADGVGDACDSCPLNVGDDCARFDPNDRDGDGVGDAVDNCPALANDGQSDRDADGAGDACDACPDASNANGAGCPATVYAVKRREVAVGAPVRLEAVVTAVSPDGRGFFVQVSPEDNGYEGVDHSGLFVYLGASAPFPAPARGDRVAVSGQPGDYYGQRQLAALTGLEVLASGVPLPPHQLVTPADVGTGGPRAAALEGALVAVEGVEVTSAAPAPGAGDRDPTNEFEVDGALRVNDLLYLLDPLPAQGDAIARLQGVLRFANEHSKLEPTGPEDVRFELAGPPTALSLPPGPLSARAGRPLEVLVRLDAPAVSAVALSVQSSDPAVLAAPPSVQIAVGARGVTLTLTAGVVGAATLSVSASGLAGASVVVEVQAAASGAGLVINELDYDQPQTDTLEFIELYNASRAPVDLSAVRLELINGAGAGSVARTIQLGDVGLLLSPGAFLVLANAAVVTPPGVLRGALPADSLQNGAPDGARLVLNETGEVIDGISYEGDAPLCVEGAGVPAELADNALAVAALARCVDGADTNNNAADFTLTSAPTPGAPNACN
ncbi:MAG: amidohydrolase family protein [Deltaproteobacteria bacterium]|nr:amidohydrolase family protein [Deltaproteobacteria bacterium]